MSAECGMATTKLGNPFWWETWCLSMFYAIEGVEDDDIDDMAESGLGNLRCETCGQDLLPMVVEYFDIEEQEDYRQVCNIVDAHVASGCVANVLKQNEWSPCQTVQGQRFLWDGCEGSWDGAGQFDVMTDRVMALPCKCLVYDFSNPQYLTFDILGARVTNHLASCDRVKECRCLQ